MSFRARGWTRRCIAFVFLCASVDSSFGQSAPVARQEIRESSDDRALQAQLEKLRDGFVRKVVAEGYKPSLPPPRIQLGDPPTFGDYDPTTNILMIATWSALSSDEKKSFEQMAQDIGGHATARRIFEGGTHRWVFTHELGHWWQACQHQTQPNSYAEEAGANRIASAFWREQDRRFMDSMVQGFRALRDSAPDPVPQGQSKAAYLDANFQKIGATDAYTWFQSDMIVDLASEVPLPSFQRALSQPLFPRYEQR